METIIIGTKKVNKRIKPLHGVNNGPKSKNLHVDSSELFKEAGFPAIRLHDTEMPMGGGEFVDIHCVFPDFNADPNCPDSYNFTCTDAYIKAITDIGSEVYYRLGESIDHGPIKKYVRPPINHFKWAKICEGIVRHYNHGWANGFYYGIKYWEIWNEPENPPMWQGTKEEYFKMYTVAANHLKSCFPEIKIGGYASCGFYSLTRPERNNEFYRSFITFFDEFLQHIKAPDTKAPLDFFSWHIYNSDPQEIIKHSKYVDEKLNEYGFDNTESHLNEWNFAGENMFNSMRSMTGASHVCSVLCELQKSSSVEMAMYYDAQPQQRYGGIFKIGSYEPSKAYFALKAYNELFKIGFESASACTAKNLYVCSASDNKQYAFVISNPSDIHIKVELSITEFGSDTKWKYWLLDDEHDLVDMGEFDMSCKTIDIKAKSVYLVRNIS